MNRPLNIRQQRFAELVASGMPATKAYMEAGYSKDPRVAESNACRMMENDGVRDRIAELRKPQTKKALMSRDDKRAKLFQIVENESIGIMARLRAIDLDSKLAGHYAPEKVEIENSKSHLESIMERAKHVRSALARVYDKEPSGKSPDGMDPPASPLEEAQQAAQSMPVVEPDRARSTLAWDSWR